jgi:hypothetical protein
MELMGADLFENVCVGGNPCAPSAFRLQVRKFEKSNKGPKGAFGIKNRRLSNFQTPSAPVIFGMSASAECNVARLCTTPKTWLRLRISLMLHGIGGLLPLPQAGRNFNASDHS